MKASKSITHTPTDTHPNHLSWGAAVNSAAGTPPSSALPFSPITRRLADSARVGRLPLRRLSSSCRVRRLAAADQASGMLPSRALRWRALARLGLGFGR